MQEDKEGLDILHIRLFGTASLTYAGRKIDCVSNRSKLTWNILTYMICNQGKLVRTEELIANVWNSSNNINPANAMRTAIFRARQMLDELIEDGSSKLLMSQNGGYMWNPTIPSVVDCMEFDRLMAEINDNPHDYRRMLSAFYLYDGRFLSQQSSDLWVIPRQVYYHKLYEYLIDRLLPVLEKEKKYFDAICACRKVLLTDPFSERNYQNLMRFLLMNNEREEVIKVYKQMSKTMLTDLGALPNQESRALYQEALSVASLEALVADDIVQDLGEEYVAKGAYICDYDCFRSLYQAHARSIERTGIPSHIVIVSLRFQQKDTVLDELSKTMDLVEQALRHALRRGDIVTRCSASQFIVLLRSADYENCQRICDRFTKVICKTTPRCRYGIEYEVRPVQLE
jgi:DNA-binding SARP family transcriptional activator